MNSESPPKGALGREETAKAFDKGAWHDLVEEARLHAINCPECKSKMEATVTVIHSILTHWRKYREEKLGF